MSTQLEGGFRLHAFKGDVEQGKTQNISASKLDANFQLLKPRGINGNLKHYTVNQETEGWDLKIFPKWPSAPSVLTFGTNSNSNPNNGNPKLGWLSLASLRANVPPAPPSGTPEWRQIERCDGQTMYVWGTEWEPS